MEQVMWNKEGKIILRQDASYVVEYNGLPYHVPNEGTFTELYADVAAYAQEHPEQVEQEAAPAPPTEEEQLALARYQANAIISAHLRATALQTATFTVAEYNTLASAHCFEAWQAGTSYMAGQRIEHNGVVYEVIQDVTAIENQSPDAAGMLAVYRPLSVDPSTGEEPDGTKENPYAYIEGMDVHEGSYYTYEGKLYLAKTDMLPCVWAPGTAGLWQWEEVTN